MNSINKKTKRMSAKKITVITTIIVIFVAVISTGYAYKAGLWPFNAKKSSTTNTTNYDPPTKEQTTATGSTKQSSNPTESSGSDSSPSPTPSTTTDQKPSVNMAITAASQANGVLSIRTLIETISDNGTCTLSMTGPNNKTYSSTVGSQANPSTTTCKGFDIPVSSLAPGIWHILITYGDSSVQSTASRDITVQ